MNVIKISDKKVIYFWGINNFKFVIIDRIKVRWKRENRAIKIKIN